MYRATEPHFPGNDEPQLPLWQPASTVPAVSLRHSRRARRVAVRIVQGGTVELVVPRGVSERQAWAFLESRADWVRHHMELRRAAQPVPEQFPPRSLHLPLLGETWRIFQAGGTGRARLVVQAAGVIELRGSGTREDWRRCLLAWLKRRAQPAFTARLEALAAQHGFTFTAVSVRCQRSRWGSCSARGAISLNLALLFQPQDVVRYLLCHELAHTRHLDHSARFWRCVAGCEPRWRELDAALLKGWRNVPQWLVERA